MNIRRLSRSNMLQQSGYSLSILFSLLAACNSSTSTSNEKSLPEPITALAAEQWNLSGIFQFPDKENATNLKIVVTADPLSRSVNSFASKPAHLILNGTPPTATFSLEIDTHLPKVVSALNKIDVMVFQDKNGNDSNDVGEEIRFVNANTGCTVWCGDLPQCTPSASFIFIPKGSSGTGTNGTYTINTTGWYYQQGCRDDGCAKLISSGSTLAGAVLTYSYYNNAPILEQQP